MSGMQKIVLAVVVTYNKADLLRQCLQSILGQQYRVDKVLVIDNGGFEETKQVLEEFRDESRVVNTPTGSNLGGAGGFNFGLKQAMSYSFDYVWIMDDDTTPNIDALSNLMQADQYLSTHKVNPGFLASNVRWTDGSAAKMNIPGIQHDWNEFDQPGIIRVEWSSFVSMLVSHEAISELGLPISDFFIWGDDLEFSLRISQKFPGYFVQSSIAVHHMGNNNPVNLLTEKEPARIERHFYDFRNRLFISKKLRGRKAFWKQLLWDIFQIFKVHGTGYAWKKVAIILKGVWAGLFFNPKVEYPSKAMK